MCRGAALEMLLSKLVAARGGCSVQIVAMSATMAGLDSLSTWLRAHLFLTNFRPVPLSEHAVFGGTVFAKAPQAQGGAAAGEQGVAKCSSVLTTPPLNQPCPCPSSRHRTVCLPGATDAAAAAGAGGILVEQRKLPGNATSDRDSVLALVAEVRGGTTVSVQTQPPAHLLRRGVCAFTH
jgi:hypothetical protein